MIMSGVVIKSGAVVDNVIIDENTVVGKKAKVGDGSTPGVNVTIIGSELVIPDGKKIGGDLKVNSATLEELI